MNATSIKARVAAATHYAFGQDGGATVVTMCGPLGAVSRWEGEPARKGEEVAPQEWGHTAPCYTDTAGLSRAAAMALA